jgi:cyclic lactone autoinducer peptide
MGYGSKHCPGAVIRAIQDRESNPNTSQILSVIKNSLHLLDRLKCFNWFIGYRRCFPCSEPNVDSRKEVEETMKKSIAYRLASVLGLIALVLVTTASVFYVNQPEVPKELLK